MSSNSSNSSKKNLGNTEPNSIPVEDKKQCSARKMWLITINNWTEDEWKTMLDWFSSNSSILYSVGKEIGEECKTPHIHIFVKLPVKLRFTALKKIFPRARLDACKGTVKQNIDYTQKDGDYIQNFVEEIYVEEPSEKLKFLVPIMKAYDTFKGDRSIHVVIDKIGGIGKTEFARWCVVNFKDCIVTGGKASDMKNQIVKFKETNNRTPKYIFIDVPRRNVDFLSYTGIEEIKNMLFYSGKFEGGMINGNKPFVCLMMNEEPDFKAMTASRWKIYKIEPEEELEVAEKV